MVCTYSYCSIYRHMVVLTFTAVFTGVWFDAGVKHLVLLEVGFGGVGVTADGTHEGLHARVGLHVQS